MLLDSYARPLRSVRVSVTDRCNLRCSYCMPEASYVWLPRSDLLSFEEIARLVDVLSGLGVSKVRLTGGEPLLRHDVAALVRLLAHKPRIEDVSLTTNGVLLHDVARELRVAGLHRLTVSLDTLRPERFLALTGRDLHGAVLAGIDAALVHGFQGIKLDSIVLRGTNDDEIPELLAFAQGIGAEVRFIEYMDVAGATRWSLDQVVGRDEILTRVEARFGRVEPIGERGSAPAERFRLASGTTFGLIASTTSPFCGACDRGRLTADGLWLMCLYAERGLDLRSLLRSGASAEDVSSHIAEAWQMRSDRGAEDRRRAEARGPIVPVEALRRDPHLEMHTRGG